MTSTAPARELDTCGLDCPLPLLKAKQALNGMNSGELLRVRATDPGSQRDFRVFAEQSGPACSKARKIRACSSICCAAAEQACRVA